MGAPETTKIPCFESSSIKCSVSERATSGSTSNWEHTVRSTISETRVRPSAACQIAVATSFSVKNVESTADITIISPPSMRAAIAVLLAMYRSFMPPDSKLARQAKKTTAERELSTNSQAERKTSFTSSGSSAKKSMLRIRRRIDSALSIGSTRFESPFSRKNNVSMGAEEFSPGPRQFAGKGRSAGYVAGSGSADIRDLVGE